MKRLMLALLVGGAVFGTVFAAAALLNVTSRDLQAGSDETLICDADGVQTSWRDGWSGGAVDDFVVTDVVVAGIDSSCDGLLLEVVLTDINGNWLASGAVSPIVSSPNPVVPMSPQPVLASAVYDVHVIIR